MIESDHTDPIKGKGAAVVADSDRCDGLVGWFTAELGGGATLINQPESSVRMQRWCNVYHFLRVSKSSRGMSLRSRSTSARCCVP